MSVPHRPSGPPREVSPELAAQMLRAVGQAVVATDIEGRILYWNRGAERLYGWPSTEAVGRHVADRIRFVDSDSTGDGVMLLAWLRTGERRVDEVQVEKRNGERVWTRSIRSPFYGVDGTIDGVIGISYDVSLTRAQERALQESETRFKALVQRSSDVAVIVEPRGRLRFVSHTVVDLLGYEPEELVDTDGWDLVHPDDLEGLQAALAPVARDPWSHTTAEYRIRTKHRGYVWVEQTVTNMMEEPAVGGIVANIRDIGDRKRMEADLSYRVLHDELTGLPNRAHLDRALDAALATSAGVAVLVLDVDQFKLINDSHGHVVGDELLVQVSERLQHALRPGDLAGRFGGDEFVVVCRDVPDVEEAERIAERLQGVLRAPFALTGVGPVFVSASVGIAAGLAGAVTAAELFHDADAAMYEAKRAGRARHMVYDDAMRSRAAHRLSIESDLRRGLDAGEICAYFQPIVDVETGRIVGAEALARWQHPVGGLIGPDEFIEIAEECGLVIDLDRLVLGQALDAAASWTAEGRDVMVTVNLSCHQLSDDGLVDFVASSLADRGLPARQLCLEVTETAVMTDTSRSIAVVEELAGMGVRLALDDFGTGYSSLAYLKSLPVTAVKVDRGFVAGVDVRADDRDIVAAILHLGRAFGRLLVAEGVETVGQLEVLRELGCPFAQGFLWSRPVDRASFDDLLASDPSGDWKVEPTPAR